MDINQIVKKQKEYFLTGKTLDITFRINGLKKLKEAIKRNEKEILTALHSDLGKSETEGYMSEVGMVYDEINYMIKNVKSLSKIKKTKTPLVQFYSKSYILPSPYGNVLIMSPWNYPFLLTIDPLVDALAAGNTAVLKPSNYSANTSFIIKKLISEIFPEEYVAVVEGGREENTELLNNKFDYIFFTGGKTVGKLVMHKAAEHLTPITLELGGKSPCIIEESANLKLAARRLVFGKFINSGQTCVAPDYVLVQKSVKDEFLDYVLSEIKAQYDDGLNNDSYGKIINEKHFERLISLISGENVLIGGNFNEDSQKITPTVLDNITLQSKVMGEEIFGPIIPIIDFDNIGDIYSIIRENDTPLALYLFSENKAVIDEITHNISFGGGCINDTIIHLATVNMPFGGVGQSGMGSYHGKYGFDTFSHNKSIVNKSNKLDLKIRYAPYNENKDKLMRRFMK